MKIRYIDRLKAWFLPGLKGDHFVNFTTIIEKQVEIEESLCYDLWKLSLVDPWNKITIKSKSKS